MPGKIFINYRRAESLKDARHLATLLDKGAFKGRIFIDLKGLDGAPDWLDELQRQVAASDAMVSVICPGWADIKGADGRRRLDSDRDFVRFELSQASIRGIPVIPVLVDGARMPAIAELPDNIHHLTRPSAEFLRQETFDADVEKIRRRIEEDIKARRGRGGVPGWMLGAAAVGALAAGGVGGVATGPAVWERLGWSRPVVGDTQAAQRIAQLVAERSEADATVRAIQAGRLRVDAELAQAKDEIAKLKTAQDAARQQAETLSNLAETRERELTAARAAAEAAGKRAETAEKGQAGAAAEAKRLSERLAAAETARAEAAARADASGRQVATLEGELGTLKTRLAALVSDPPGLTPGTTAGAKGRVAGAAKVSDPKGLTPGTVFRDCPQCPEMVVVPGGSFTMGSNDGPSDEKPTRTVTIRQPFAVGKFEVTFAEWQACVDGGGCKGNPRPNDHGWGRDRRPVIDVSWNHAKEYVAWLSGKTGHTYRLLTEAEWEYAARAGNPGRWTFGDDERRLGEFGWFSANAGRKTQPVGGKTANAFGLQDMHGNVWEWVEDCYADNYNAAPTDGSAAKETTSCRRVHRGGSWNSDPVSLRSADRNWDSSVVRSLYLGLRVGRTL